MNILLEVFEEKPVRFIRSAPQELWVPVNDVADAIGYDRDTLRQLINRNGDLFANMCSKSVILLEGVGSREVLCVPVSEGRAVFLFLGAASRPVVALEGFGNKGGDDGA